MTKVLPLIMARMRPIIHTRKEIIDSVGLAIGAGVTTTTILATAVNDYVGTVGTVEVGSKIKWLYLFVQQISTVGTGNSDWYILKSPAVIGLPTPGATGGDATRKYILHEEKGIPGNAGDGAYPLTFKGVIKIPRGRQRMAEGDTIRLVSRTAIDVSNLCIKSIYKSEM